MNETLFALCGVFLVCSAAISQVVPNKTPPQPVKARPPAASLAGGPAQAGLPLSASEDFVIGPEDVLDIKVWREPDLSTKTVVRPDGKIGVTLLGDIQASGLTTRQLKETIASKLSRLLEQPEVSVVIVEIHSQLVHLIGHVGRPGAYTLGGPLTVVELLARAGGLTETAKSEDIAIVRKKAGGEVERIPFNYKTFIEGRNLERNILLKNGDVVVVR